MKEIESNETSAAFNRKWTDETLQATQESSKIETAIAAGDDRNRNTSVQRSTQHKSNLDNQELLSKQERNKARLRSRPARLPKLQLPTLSTIEMSFD